MSELNTIERSALCRVARLGDLYDARSDQFRGINVFKTRIPKSCITFTDNPSSNSAFVLEETFAEKFEKLCVSSELTLSFLGGLVAVEGSGQYLNDEKTSAKSIRATWIKRLTTVVQKLELANDELRDLVSDDVLDCERATHFVIEVHWGGAACLTLENADSGTADTRNKDLSISTCGSRSNMEDALKTLAAYPLATASAEYVNNLNNISKKFSFKLHGDVVPENSDHMQIGLMTACAHVSRLSARLRKANGGKGKPVKYILYPLSNRALKGRIGTEKAINNFYRPIEESVSAQFVCLFDNISYVKQQVFYLVSDVSKHRACLTHDIVTEILNLQTDLETGESALRSELADTRGTWGKMTNGAR
jgi:hypothetical protein